MSYPAYPEYKDSGVEWLGEVPAHWAIERLKLSTVSCQNGIWGSDPQGDENDVICIRVADFDRTHMRVKLDTPTYRNVTEAEFKSRKVTSGDLLLEKSGGGEKQPVGFVALYDAEEAAVCANFIARIKLAPEMNSSFWRYVHAAGYAIGLNIPSIKQTSGIQNLDQHSYLNERAAYPPSVEQDYIAAFLDHETARIDALVEEQQRLIALLKEKRQAVISHAVTKGLDPNVPMKDSGVEWLGEVPKHWPQVRLKHVVSQIIDTEHKTVHFHEDGEYLVVRTSNVRNGELILERAKYTDAAGYKEWTSRGRPQPGDVLFTREAPAGEACLVPHGVDLCLGQRMVLFIVNKARVDSQFLIYSIYAGLSSEFIESLSQGSTVVHFNMSDIRNIPLFEPSLEEQESICGHLRTHLDCFDRLIEEACGSVELMKERRSALISAAVTGKIDVRGWQPPEKLQATNDTQKGHEVASV